MFPLERELQTTVSEHRGAYWLDCQPSCLLTLDLTGLKDNCGQKPERLWYGNTAADFTFNKEVTAVPQFLLEDIGYDEENFVTV